MGMRHSEPSGCAVVPLPLSFSSTPPWDQITETERWAQRRVLCRLGEVEDAKRSSQQLHCIIRCQGSQQWVEDPVRQRFTVSARRLGARR